MSYRSAGKVKAGIEDASDEEIVQKIRAENDDVNVEEDSDEEINQVAEQFNNCVKIKYVSEVVEHMYHVTRSTAHYKNILKEGFHHKRAHCRGYDGELLHCDAPAGIFFAVTRYHGSNNEFYMPSITQYPRESSHPEGFYPRIAVRLDSLKLETEYFMFWIKEATTPPCQKVKTNQLHVAFIHESRRDALEWARVFLTPLDTSLNGIMYFEDKRRWKAPTQKQPGECDLWTNVFLVPAESDHLLSALSTAVVGYVEKRTSNYKFKKRGAIKLQQF